MAWLVIAGKIRPSLDSRPWSRFNTPLISISGQVAQLVEQGTENPRVGSSILSLATMNFKSLRDLSRRLFLCVRKRGCLGLPRKIKKSYIRGYSEGGAGWRRLRGLICYLWIDLFRYGARSPKCCERLFVFFLLLISESGKPLGFAGGGLFNYWLFGHDQ